MGRCNYCTHIERVRAAKRHNLVITTRDDPQPHAPHGVLALKHPRDEEPDREKHFLAWYMSLPTECKCHE